MMASTDPVELFVGDLNENITKEMLFTEFSRFGKILDIKIMKHQVTKRSRGHGFITFANYKQGSHHTHAALEAKNNMRNAVLMGDRMRVLFKGDHRKMNKDCMVIITNIDPDVDYDELEEACNKYGVIDSMKFSPDAKDEYTYRAVLFYSTPEQAKAAVKNLNGTMIKEKPLVAVLETRHHRIVVVKGEIFGGRTMLPIFKQRIQYHCAQFGNIVSNTICECTDRSKFVCFVEFEDRRSVDMCMQYKDAIKGFSIEIYTEGRQKHNRGGSDEKRGKGAPKKKPAKVADKDKKDSKNQIANQIIIKPLKGDITKQQLWQIFGNFGTIKNIELGLIQAENNSTGLQVSKITFENHKSLATFHTYFQKYGVVKFKDLSPEGVDLKFHFSLNFIENLKRQGQKDKPTNANQAAQVGVLNPNLPGLNRDASKNIVTQFVQNATVAVRATSIKPYNAGSVNGVSRGPTLSPQRNPIVMAPPVILPPHVYVLPQQSHNPLNNPGASVEQTKNFLWQSISHRLQPLLPEDKVHYTKRLSEDLTSLDLFSVEEMNRMLVDKKFLEDQVQELIVLYDQGH